MDTRCCSPKPSWSRTGSRIPCIRPKAGAVSGARRFCPFERALHRSAWLEQTAVCMSPSPECKPTAVRCRSPSGRVGTEPDGRSFWSPPAGTAVSACGIDGGSGFPLAGTVITIDALHTVRDRTRTICQCRVNSPQKCRTKGCQFPD